MIPTNFEETLEKEKDYNFSIGHNDESEKHNQYLKKEYEESTEFQNLELVRESFIKEYNNYIELKTYFIGCPLNVYTTTYKDRLNNFLEQYTDSKEHNFINDELLELLHYKTPYFVQLPLSKSITYSIEQTKDFLIQQLEKLDFDISLSKDSSNNTTLEIGNYKKDLSIEIAKPTALKWQANKTDLVELGMALIETKSINIGTTRNELSEKEFYELLASFFNVDKLNHEQTKQKIKTRKKEETTFLPKLNNTLIESIKDSHK